MELFRSELFYIFVKNENSLWWNRVSGEFTVKSAWDLSSLEDIECLGITEGIIGKVEHSSVYEPRLIIIKESAPVGQIYVHHTVHKIKSICFLNLGVANTEIDLVPCPKHGPVGHVSADEMRSGSRKTGTRLFENSPFLNKTFGVVKSAGHTLKNTTQQAATQVKQTVNKRRDPKVAERFEKRINDELHKIFDDTDSFYYSRTLDITNTLQRQFANEQKMVSENPAVDRNNIANWWKHVDDRFFWNKHMLKDIIDMGSPECDPWILPIIQGYIQLMQCAVDMSDISGHLNTESLAGTNSSCDEVFTIGVISRRSRYQAGTRYNRRGIEPEGKVANYVETEQIVSIVCTDSVHRASFVQVRGSVPIYWSQPGYKARPPPRLDRTEEESHEAFKKHFSEELSLYKQICIVNLVEQTGREKVICDAYSNHVLKYNNPNLIYATFDFHEYCRGMHYENVSVLINALADVIDDMKFCWRDDRGIICSQMGTFRVNCIDCLDRTNVVQTAIAKSILEIQLARLGLASPGAPTPPALRTAFLTMWADNGDVISRQYAGTNALKGDYTRTGERKFTGIMKDGMNSASRFFIQNFADSMRQCAIDLALGNPIDATLVDRHDNVCEFIKTVGSIAYENTEGLMPTAPAPQLIPDYFVHTRSCEMVLAEIGWGIGRYYLSTFKDAVRQIAIDMMTGESKAIPEDVLRQANQPGADSVLVTGTDRPLESEEDTQTMAMHVKALIDDCKKLLVCDSVTVLGSWGLIDADPNTGDPLETDMDSVLILTADSYYVADYDDQTDRVVAFQTIPLQDVTLLEFGLPDVSNQTFNMLKTNFSVGKKPTKPASTPEVPYCIRINYRVNNVDGYFHMFRSTNLRFFNNMAVVIKTKEEIMESLRSICESFIVARDISNLPALPFMDGVKLEKKKSKVHPNVSSVTGRTSRNSLYLDLSKLPTITRNVSETQLVADIRSVVPSCVKSKAKKKWCKCPDEYPCPRPYPLESTCLTFAHHSICERDDMMISMHGSKALNNMSEQFSKLNKLTSLNSRSKPTLHLKLDSQERPKKTFTLGQNRTNTDSLRSSKKKGSLSDGMSSDYSSDDENRTNIFEPTLDNFENLQHYIGSTDSKNNSCKKDSQDTDAYLMENPLYMSQTTHSSEATSSTNDFASSLGNFSDNQSNIASIENSNIVSCGTPQLKAKHNPFNTICDIQYSAGSLDVNNRSSTPEITVEAESTNVRPVPPNNLKQVQKFSHSSCEMNLAPKSGSDEERSADLPDGTYHVRSNSEHHIFLNIAQSQSESALKQLANITSPVSNVTKDLVLSPFSKIAKGMQHLGANLDPRRMKGVPNLKQPNEQRDEEHRQLQEKWKDCKTRLIAL